MTLLASRLNSARFTSCLADIIAQFGSIPAGLQASEIAQITAARQKLAHAMADHEGTDVVTEIVTNAVVPAGQTCATPNTLTGTVTSAGVVT